MQLFSFSKRFFFVAFLNRKTDVEIRTKSARRRARGRCHGQLPAKKGVGLHSGNRRRRLLEDFRFFVFFEPTGRSVICCVRMSILLLITAISVIEALNLLTGKSVETSRTMDTNMHLIQDRQIAKISFFWENVCFFCVCLKKSQCESFQAAFPFFSPGKNLRKLVLFVIDTLGDTSHYDSLDNG